MKYVCKCCLGTAHKETIEEIVRANKFCGECNSKLSSYERDWVINERVKGKIHGRVSIRYNTKYATASKPLAPVCTGYNIKIPINPNNASRTAIVLIPYTEPLKKGKVKMSAEKAPSHIIHEYKCDNPHCHVTYHKLNMVSICKECGVGRMVVIS